MFTTPSLNQFKSDSRGQLILLGGIIIVISLVVIVFTLNTVLYAQNIESHETAPEGKEAIEYIDTARQSFGSAIIAENKQNHTSKSAARSNTLETLYGVNHGIGEQYSHKQGVYATINPVRITDGTVIQHTDSSCTFESAKADCNGDANTDPVASYSYSPSSPDVNTDTGFDASSSGDPDGSVNSYEWDFNGDGTIDDTGSTAVYNYSTPGVYQVTLIVTDDDGATDTRTKQVAVSDSAGDVPPAAAFSFYPGNPEPNETIDLTAASSFDVNDDITSYEWDFNGDGTTDATGENVTTSYASSGTYDVSLTVTDSAGYTRTVTKSVSVANEGSGDSAYSIGSNAGSNLGVGHPSDVSTIDWELGKTSDVRRFRFNVEETDLGTSIDSSALDDSTILRNNAFHILFTDQAGNEWRVYIYASGSDDVVVSTQQNDGSINIQYQQPVNEATIDLTSGTVNGVSRQFEFAPGLSGPYTIEYRNGDVASGTYSLVVPNDDFGTSTLRDGNFNSASSTQSPYTSSGIYSARFRLTFTSPSVLYETTLRVAPNEPEGDN